MLVVSDTTAISNLLQIKAIDLLRKLYGNVIIPKSVEQEIIIEARRRGYLSSVRKIMDELREIGFWISEKLYQEVLETEAKL